MLLIAVAFAAGILSFLTPCVLPLLPLVVGASSTGGNRRPLGIVVGLGVSFVLVVVILASTLAALGITTAELRLVAIVGLLLVGLTILLPGLRGWTEQRLQPLVDRGLQVTGSSFGRDDTAGSSGSGFRGGLAIGAALGLVWAPCVGPIMAGVIAVAISRGPSPEAALIAAAYVAGAALPLYVIGVRGRSLVRRAWSGRLGAAGRTLTGMAMLVTAIAILTGSDLLIQNAVADALPAGWTSAIYSIEKTPGVSEGSTAMDQHLTSPHRP